MGQIPVDFLTIDPGKWHCGAAVFKNNSLHQGLLLSNPMALMVPSKALRPDADGQIWAAMANEVVALLRHYDPDTIVLEVPQVYQMTGKGDPNDLIHLAGIVGGIAAIANRPTVTLRPREWKKQVKKEVMLARIENRLSPDERKCINRGMPANLRHNVIDAIGIGLYVCGRLD